MTRAVSFAGCASAGCAEETAAKVERPGLADDGADPHGRDEIAGEEVEVAARARVPVQPGPRSV